MVEMFDDRIEISDFGGLPKGLKLQDFGKKSVLRNPAVAGLLHRIEYIEKMGTGIRKMRRIIKKAGLPSLKFEFGNFFTIIFKRPKTKQAIEAPAERFENFGINFGIKGKKLERIAKILEVCYRGQLATADQLAELFKTTSRTIESDIELLKDKKLIRFEGARKTGKYVLTQKGRRLFESKE